VQGSPLATEPSQQHVRGPGRHALAIKDVCGKKQHGKKKLTRSASTEEPVSALAAATHTAMPAVRAA
jgi:hypothetical protein